jgi:TetR/AcrR family transcriptional regulator, lmrAB and yxaGH operons repressor
MARPSDARSRLIRVSSALFRQRGYDGVGLTEILEASGAPKGSFYHHFPGGKEQLGEACILYAGEQIGAAMDAAMGRAAGFPAGVRAFAQGIADWFERSGFREGCPITSIVLATAPQSRSHAEAAEAVFGAWRRRLIAHAERLAAPLDPAGAELFFVLMEGAWILARVQQSKEPLLRAAEAFIGAVGLKGIGAQKRT